MKLEEFPHQCLGDECYVMTINQSPKIPMFWDCNHFVQGANIQNIFARPRSQVVSQNNHFADNTKQGKTDKGHKI